MQRLEPSRYGLPGFEGTLLSQHSISVQTCPYRKKQSACHRVNTQHSRRDLYDLSESYVVVFLAEAIVFP